MALADIEHRELVPEQGPGNDLAYLDAMTLGEAFRRRALSPVEVARALIRRIEALDPRFNAVVRLEPERTLCMARASEQRHFDGMALSALDGVPVTVKDLSAISGWPKQRGSLAFDPSARSAEDTPCVARLREAGVVFLAKTATPEAGCKIVTRSPAHGVTANPYDRTRTPGGSSGGASAALALGFGPLAVGSDGAGSIRIPASFTNVFGLKPGFGRVPAFPPDIDMPHSVVGPMARRVRDAAVMLEVMSRLEPRDPYAWPVPFAMLPNVDAALDDLKVAVSPRFGCNARLVDGEVDALTAQAGPLLADAGARVEECDPVWPLDPFAPFKLFWETGCAATVNSLAPDKRPLADPLLARVARAGRTASLNDYFRALQQRTQIAAAAQSFFNRFDLLVGPVMPVPPWSIDRDVPEGFADEDWSWCPYTYPWNMAGVPAASVPIGFTKSGLPVGVQIVGPMGSEANILRVAAAIEMRRPLYLRRPVL